MVGTMDVDYGDDAIDEALIQDLVETYGWWFKPLTPLGSFNNRSRFAEKDIARLNYCNEMILEYLEDHADMHEDAANISDRKLIVYVTGELSDREGTTKQNIYQWMAPHIRLEYSGLQNDDEWIHIKDHREELDEKTTKEYRKGVRDAHKDMSEDE